MSFTKTEDVVINDDGSNILKIYSKEEWMKALIAIHDEPDMRRIAEVVGKDIHGMAKPLLNFSHGNYPSFMDPLVRGFPKLVKAFETIRDTDRGDMVYMYADDRGHVFDKEVIMNLHARGICPARMGYDHSQIYIDMGSYFI